MPVTPTCFDTPITSRLTFQRTACVLAVVMLLSACSALEEDKINYKSAGKAPALDVPPDLTQLRKDSRYVIENTSATASGFKNAAGRVADAGTASNVVGKARVERQGHQRWLVVDLPADQVWESLRTFWTDNGFVLSTDTPDVGIMETEWAENRAKLPQDFIRKTLGKVLDSLYSTGERDKFRTRVERNPQGGVEIYIIHRGMVENFADAQKERTIWQPRPNDPELEIEFLRRLMVKLGSSPESAKTALPVEAKPTATELTRIDGHPAIVLNDSLDRVWRRTGVALDRSGFTVEDRDRTTGIYFVRYVAATSAGETPGFFSRLFSTSKDQQPSLSRYRLSLSATAQGQTSLRVLNATGQPETSTDAERILKLLADQLR
jgi:outer membrane protein assembly factor BamC